ncbi:MAG: NAD(P)-dependent oxidoreductase [Actinomycetia bacterium]|nr:NAD(P)-dependent oxidoreductase [Actinomycetes bacterium]MCP3910601.1 NAD(P)-dependent oxidoreductase [Actinomycetes bacterium]MCP4086355.1 NAD(P)-dependent oxidoreductase [Actinomycetes bacterium]
MASVSFIGLGVMGYPMAGHLQAAGHDVTVWNRTTNKAADWVAQHGGQTAPTPREAAEGSQVVFVCVGDDPDVQEVVLGQDGALAGMSSGTTLVDHTTTSADLARELAEAGAAQGVGFLDAPVSGGEAGAQNGQLAVMCGGEPEVFERVGPLIDTFAKARTLIGPTGHGQLCKSVNQICIAGLVQGLSEAIAFGQKSGIDMDKVLDAISGGAAGSWQMANRGQTMVAREFDFGFAVDWMRKDLRIALAQAEAIDADLTVTRLVDGYYSEVQEAGHNRWDTSSLVSRL